MKQFLRLTEVLLNTSRISHVTLSPNKYTIHLARTNMEGFIMYGSGIFWTQRKDIEVDKLKQPADYALMTEWMQRETT